MSLFPFQFGPGGRSIVVDASGRLVATGDVTASGYPLGFGETGRTIVVDDSGRLILSVLSPGLGGAGGGEVNTASNVGSSGLGFFKLKSGVNLQFKKLVVGNELAMVSGVDVHTIGPSPFVELLSAASVSVDMSAANKFFIELDDAATFVFNGPVDGSKYCFLISQFIGTGTITWPATVQWRGHTAPTLTASTGVYDFVTMIYNSTLNVFLADVGLDFGV